MPKGLNGPLNFHVKQIFTKLLPLRRRWSSSSRSFLRLCSSSSFLVSSTASPFRLSLSTWSRTFIIVISSILILCDFISSFFSSFFSISDCRFDACHVIKFSKNLKNHWVPIFEQKWWLSPSLAIMKILFFSRKWSFLFEISIFDQECINITWYQICGFVLCIFRAF